MGVRARKRWNWVGAVGRKFRKSRHQNTIIVVHINNSRSLREDELEDHDQKELEKSCVQVVDVKEVDFGSEIVEVVDDAEASELPAEKQKQLREEEERTEKQKQLREEEEKCIEKQKQLREEEEKRIEKQKQLHEEEERIEKQKQLRDEEERTEKQKQLREEEERVENQKQLRIEEERIEKQKQIREEEERIKKQKQLREEERTAAIKIQSFFRGLLARRAFRALRGLVKLQALVRGVRVRKQQQMALHCMGALIRLQMRVQSRQLLMKTCED
ncbi:hypothetical protein MKX01_006257 [Papaver californicum]|nr:hypothetical protein MKX01_006257 [Papaver californicum]